MQYHFLAEESLHYALQQVSFLPKILLEIYISLNF